MKNQDEIKVVLTSTGENTPSNFSTKLLNPLNLEGNWRVALSEITISPSVINITSDEFVRFEKLEVFRYKRGETRAERRRRQEKSIEVYKGNPHRIIRVGTGNYLLRPGESLRNLIVYGKYERYIPKLSKDIHIQCKRFTSVEGLIEYIHSQVKPEDEIHSKITFDKNSQKINVKVAENERIIFSTKLRSLFSCKSLIFNVEQPEGVTFSSDYCVDIRLHFWNIYIYSNLTNPIILGDMLSPLLQTVPLDILSEEKLSTVTFNPKIFQEISNHFIPEIKISICNELGEPLQFITDCTTICKLVFIKNV